MSSGVEFEEDSFGSTTRRPVAQSPYSSPPNFPSQPGGSQMYGGGNQNVPGLAGWLMRHGVAKSSSSAQTILIGIVVANIIITFIVIKYFL
ncbi:MAG: hypothetical protein WCT02_03545 [Candidatus Paceibacterota bacterium]